MPKPIAHQPGYTFNPAIRRWVKDESNIRSTVQLPAPNTSQVYTDFSTPDESVQQFFGHNDEFSRTEVEDDLAYLRPIINDLTDAINADPDYLPPIDDFNPGERDGEFIVSLDALRYGINARGQCNQVSESIHYGIDHLTHGDIQYHSVVCYEMSPEDREATGLNIHYANYVRIHEDGPGFIVDYTFSQIDESAPFPLVVEPEQWVNMIRDGMYAQRVG